MKMIYAPIARNSCYKINEKMDVKGLMLHSIGCPQPRADVFAERWNDPYKEVAVHGFIDGNSGEIWQFLPWDICGWHAGGVANKTHIGVEMGEPACIKYKPSSATFTIKDEDVAEAVNTAERTYHSAVELFAWLCGNYDLDPLGDGVIIGHAEGHARGVASNHGDPEHLWKQLGMKYTMNTFRRDVAAKLGKVTPETETEKGEIMYTVRKGDTLSEIGARFGVEWRDLVVANNIVDPSLIYVGQTLKIPLDGVSIYTVKQGDSLWKIAKEAYGSGWKYRAIVEANGLNGTTIHVGDTLIIPKEE